MATANKTKPKDPVVIEGGTIKQTRLAFIELKSIGQCDSTGKAVFSIGFKGKLVSELDKPFQTVLAPLVNEFGRFTRYTSDDAASADLKAFQEWVASLSYSVPPPMES